MSYRLCFLLFMLLFSSCNAGKGTEKPASEDPRALMLADLQFTDLDGNSFSGERFKGQPVFVHFWATWCRPCIKEMPHLAQAIQKSENITFLFPSDEPIDKIIRFKEKNDFPFQYLQISSGFGIIGVSVLPTTYIFNSKGELVQKITGSKSWDTPQMKELLNTVSGY